MLKFIKKLFAKEEIQEEEIILNELNVWLDEKANPLFESLDNNINQIINKINDEKEKVAENLKTLENAKLQNPKIPERVKTIMEGNRSAFIKKVSFFFDNLDLKCHRNLTSVDYSSESQISRMPKIDNSIFVHNNKKDYNEWMEKCNRIKNEIDSLGKSTARSYQVLNEFFAREAENIAINIKNIESYSNKIKNSIQNNKISAIGKIKDNIIEIQHKTKLKEKYAGELENNKNNLQSNKNKKTDIEKKIDELKQENGYQNYKRLLEEKNKLELQMNDIENRLFHDFSVLGRAFKKYAKIAFENEKLILEYMSSPIKALMIDADLKIIKILNDLKISIMDNKLELDSKKSEKTLLKIEELSHDYFADTQNSNKNLNEELNKINLEIKNNESQKQLELNKKELENVKLNIEKLNNSILTLNSELEKINIKKLKEKLQNEVNEVINARVKII